MSARDGVNVGVNAGYAGKNVDAKGEERSLVEGEIKHFPYYHWSAEVPEKKLIPHGQIVGLHGAVLIPNHIGYGHYSISQPIDSEPQRRVPPQAGTVDHWNLLGGGRRKTLRCIRGRKTWLGFVV
ncbi:histone chaperone ASF1 [Striga asiatica]|uniref:Histone chaperone ASF1 n=1 Tax=Striga asiatica TaxID=4170 RepID=A0A5A7QBH3_STRAF|nr:histone chaperone ASF1 [Striga asiatica]